MNQDVKKDNGKLRLDLLPFRALDEVAKVSYFGASKYGAYSYRKGMQWSRIIAAILRHIFAFIRGEDYDDESGCLHLAHAACNLLFLIEYFTDKLGEDDRYKGE